MPFRQLALDRGDVAASTEHRPEPVVERRVIGLAQPRPAADRARPSVSTSRASTSSQDVPLIRPEGK